MRSLMNCAEKKRFWYVTTANDKNAHFLPWRHARSSNGATEIICDYLKFTLPKYRRLESSLWRIYPTYLFLPDQEGVGKTRLVEALLRCFQSPMRFSSPGSSEKIQLVLEAT